MFLGAEHHVMEEGDLFTFECPLNISGLYLHWEKDNRNVSANRVLLLLSTRHEDSGVYHCKNEENQTFWTIRLSVSGKNLAKTNGCSSAHVLFFSSVLSKWPMSAPHTLVTLHTY